MLARSKVSSRYLVRVARRAVLQRANATMGLASGWALLLFADCSVGVTHTKGKANTRSSLNQIEAEPVANSAIDHM